ncbi:MAG: hypothetical protein ABI861_04585 [Panacibacter sp.]
MLPVLQSRLSFVFHEIIDVNTISEFYDDDLESVSQAFTIFLDVVPNDAIMLATASEKENIMHLQKILHRIKPVFGYVGLNGLVEKLDFYESECGKIDSVEQIREELRETTIQINGAIDLIRGEKKRLAAYIDSEI